MSGNGRGVMMCVVVDGHREECCIDTAVMCLQLPFMRAYSAFHVHFAPSYKEAMTAFQEAEARFDTLLCVPSSKANSEFALAAFNTDHPLVVGMSVTPRINWSAYERGEPCCEYDVPRAHLGRIDTRTGYARLLVDAYDMVERFPECFVMGRGFNAQQDPVHVDTRNTFKSSGRVEFAGCLKLRYLRSNA